MSADTPERRARRTIDRALAAAGWVVQDRKRLNLLAGPGVAVREFRLKPGFGQADYLLYVNQKAVGVVEAKAEGTTLTGVELQAARYSEGLPDNLPAPLRPLPFLYQSTGVETRFTNGLDPVPRSRGVFGFHRPETFAALLVDVAGRHAAAAERRAGYGADTLRGRLRSLPPLDETGLWPAQVRAVRHLEASLAAGRPRALVQMATGSGKTFTAITSIYRLLKYGGAGRVLFLVDRGNLGRQAKKEFDDYRVPGDGRTFTQLLNVQHVTSSHLDDVSRVHICTIQRLYSMLRGEELPEEADEQSLGELSEGISRPREVAYNPRIPIESYDVIFVDECHRSIYTVWRQVLEYFDAFVVGLTATPSKQTMGFFHQNLVMEYGHSQAVADRVNVDFDVYRIRTQITEQGATVEAGLWVDQRDLRTRQRRAQELDDELTYGGDALDRAVVAEDQIRTVLETFRDRVRTEIFPGRTTVPKTLIFAKDDSHADDIVQIARDVFGERNEFVQKITYRTEGKKDDLISQFRTGFLPRIAVTVDMIATGTDIKPVEVVMFMRQVKSRNLFEQMKGRGVRVIDPTTLRAVTPDADAKTRFVIVDCVGVCEQELVETASLERKPSVRFEALLETVAAGGRDPEVVSSLAGRLARLNLALDRRQRDEVARAAGGVRLEVLVAAMVAALDPAVQADRARADAGLPAGAEPTEGQVERAAEALIAEALRPLADPDLRDALSGVRRAREQTVDTVSQDVVLESAFSAAARERARSLVTSFEAFLAEHRDEITALQVMFSRPYARRPTYDEVRALARAIEAPPRRWSTDALWHAYETLDASRVRAAPARVLTDVVALVRFAMHAQDELVPVPEVAGERFARWMAQQEAAGRRFTAEQREWLEAIRDHLAANLEITPDDFGYAPFVQRGGLGGAYRVFGDELAPLLNELTEVLAA